MNNESELESARSPFDIGQAHRRGLPLLPLMGVEYPCGEETCNPLSESCIIPGNKKDAGLARFTCNILMTAEAAVAKQDLLKANNEQFQAIIERLSKDELTGILTFNALLTYYDRLEESGYLEMMRKQGYRLELGFFDVDKLKVHNTLGGHEGGDAAIAAAVERIQRLYRREGDYVALGTPEDHEDDGLLGNVGATERAVKQHRLHNTISRFDRGDEIVVLSFIPPEPPEPHDRRQDGPEAEERRISEIRDTFYGCEAHYFLGNDINMNDAANYSHRDGLDGVHFSMPWVGDRRQPVHAKVSVTFALLRSKVPLNREALIELRNQGSAQMMNVKNNRKFVRTDGVYKTIDG